MANQDAEPSCQIDEIIHHDLLPGWTGLHQDGRAASQQADEGAERTGARAADQVHVEPGAVELAEVAYQRWLDAGDGRAGLWLGGLLHNANRVTEAQMAYRQAAELGDEHAKAVLEEIGDNPGPTDPSKRRL